MWNLYVTVVILGFTSGVYMETCPSMEDIRPCECRSKENSENILVKCKSNAFAHKPIDFDAMSQALKSLSQKNNVELDLNRVKIPTLSTNLFSGIGIKRLSVTYCNLENLTNDDQPLLQGLENHLEELRIAHNIVRRKGSPKLKFDHLKNLKKLELNIRKGLKELGDDLFSNGPLSLEILNLYHNDIEKLGSNAFAELSNLKELRLEDNDYFGPIKRSMLPTTADRLVKLSLKDNGLTDLPEDMFSGMTSLLEMNLFGNRLTTLDESTWSPIWQQLEKLNLGDNRIRCDDRLEWTSKMEKMPDLLFGKCYVPKEFKNWSLRDFIKRQQV